MHGALNSPSDLMPHAVLDTRLASTGKEMPRSVKALARALTPAVDFQTELSWDCLRVRVLLRFLRANGSVGIRPTLPSFKTEHAMEEKPVLPLLASKAHPSS
jgi:hypothetical protein